MATTYVPPGNIAGVGVSPVLPEFTLPTNALSLSVPNASYTFAPPPPLPGGSGGGGTVGYAI